MWELDYKEGWGPKNWCFWIVVLEKALLSPLDCKEIKPVNPKEISPESSLEGLILKLKLQYFGHLMGRTDSLEKTLMLRKIEGKRRRGQQRMRWLMASLTLWTWVWVNSGDWWWTGRPGSPWGHRVRQDWATELKILCVLPFHSSPSYHPPSTTNVFSVSISHTVLFHKVI